MDKKLFLLPFCFLASHVLSMEESCDSEEEMPELIEFNSISELKKFWEENGIIPKIPSKTNKKSVKQCDEIDKIILRWKYARIFQEMHEIRLKLDSIDMIKNEIEELNDLQKSHLIAQKNADIKAIIQEAYKTIVKPLQELDCFENDSFLTIFANREEFATYKRIQQCQNITYQ